MILADSGEADNSSHSGVQRRHHLDFSQSYCYCYVFGFVEAADGFHCHLDLWHCGRLHRRHHRNGCYCFRLLSNRCWPPPLLLLLLSHCCDWPAPMTFPLDVYSFWLLAAYCRCEFVFDSVQLCQVLLTLLLDFSIGIHCSGIWLGVWGNDVSSGHCFRCW